MITRIVKMTFKPEYLEEFKKKFYESQNLIKAFDGCVHLELLNDLQDEYTFFTISHWNSEEDLELYRNSYLFKNIWSKVKPLFAKKAEAWSLTSIK
jgi:quinol monooxygenase YgiN